MAFSKKNNNTIFTLFFNKARPDRYEWFFVTVLTSALATFLFYDALNGYWRFDDGFHLMFAVEYSPWQYFFDPAITRAQSGANVTPWNALFYDISLSIFGFNSKGFYLHSLLLIVATALALYALLRHWLLLRPALLGIILFLLGKPTLHMAHELMCGHYLTGMLFSLLSLNFFIHYIRHHHCTNLLVSLLLYILAISCKETYVPLVAVLLFIPAGCYKQRIIALLPFALIVVGYALWRYAVLGAWVGGYKSGVEISYQFIAEQLTHIPFVLWSKQGLGLIGVISLILLSLAACKKRLFNLPLTLASIFIISVPLIPLILSTGISQPGRYLFLPWVAMCIWIAIIFQPHKQNKVYATFKYICAIVLIISSSIGHQHEAQDLKKTITHAENIYRFTMEADFSKEGLVLNSNGTADEYWAYVSSFARHAYDLSKGSPLLPVFIITSEVHSINDLLSSAHRQQVDIGSMQFYQYRHEVFNTVDVKLILNTFLDKLKAGKEQYFDVYFSHKKGLLSWNIQPNNLAYSVMLWPKKSYLRYREIPISGVGLYPWHTEYKTDVSLSFKSPSGWLATSSKIKIEPNQQKEAMWQGKSDAALTINLLESLLQLEE